MKQEYQKERKDNEKEQSSIQEKLPKLMTRGTSLDWQKIWSQFESKIDRSELSQVSKFSYLKEMLKPKIRAFAADRFPFTTEGYEKAKNILKSKYGKDSGVANAYIQGLISLLTVNNSSPQKINEFYKKLYTHMQVLDTMGKLREIKDYVRLTLDRLPDIKSNLVKLKANDKWDD